MEHRRALPARPAAARSFQLDERVVFLNHGSFGAVPAEIAGLQQDWQRRMEREPVRFFVEDLEVELDAVRRALAGFLGADPDGLAFVPNATAGVNTVVRSLAWRAGDELLTSTHEYNACTNALRWVSERYGARVVTARLPFPVRDEDQIVDAVMSEVTARTRMALVSTCTSPSAMVLPAARLVRELQSRGVEVLLDAAHGPGFVPLDLGAMGAEYVTGNAHKWLCAPKGSAFLHVRADKIAAIRPLTISHGANSPRTDRSRFRLEFDYTGTCDPSPWLVLPAVLERVPGLQRDGHGEDGWRALMARNRMLAIKGRQMLLAGLGGEACVPEVMLGAMAAVALPDPPPGLEMRPTKYVDALQDALLARHAVQVPVHRAEGQNGQSVRVVRISAQMYNSEEQYGYLAAALSEELERERREGEKG